MISLSSARLETTNESVTDQVYRLVRAAIVELQLPPGVALSENSLVQQIGVSRTPIREALQRLEGDKLVHVFPQRGSYVPPLDMRVIRSAYVIRSAVEAAVAGEAALRRTAGDVTHLRSMLASQHALMSAPDFPNGATDRFFEQNRSFHRALMNIADLTAVEDVVQVAKMHLDRVRVAHLTFAAPYPLLPLVEEHAAIVDAIEARDKAGAETAMRDHISKVLPRLDLLRQQRPEFFKLPRDLGKPLTLASQP